MCLKVVASIIVSSVMLYAPFSFSQDSAYFEGVADSTAENISPERISLDFKDIEIVDALTFLAKKAGFNIIPTKAVTGRISLTVDNVLAQDVFDVMLRSNGLAYDKQGDIYNVMTEDEYEALYGKNFSDKRQVKIFHLKYAIPEKTYNLCEALKSSTGKVIFDSESGNLLIMDTPLKLEEMETVINSLEQKSTVVEIFDLDYASAKDVADALKSQLDLKKVGTIKADERSNQVIVQTLPERIKDIRTMIKGLDRKTREVLMDVKIIQVKLQNNLDRGIEWEGLFDIGRKYGMMYLGSYPFSAVQTSTSAWRSRQQVWNDTGGVGSYPFSGTASGSATGFNSSVPATGLEKMHIGLVGVHDFDVLFRYLRTIGETKVVANPKIAVVENQEARIHIGEKQAYITNTTTQTTSTTTIAEDVTFVDVGIQLFLTATINDEGFVTVKVRPEISSVISFIETSQQNQIPIISTSTAETTVLIKDKSTILIGGLKDQSETTATQETPFLSKIPLLGYFFSTTNKDKKRNEFMVMLTPHVIGGDEFTTGDQSDFGYERDKNGQDYPQFAKELPAYKPKSYQEYTSLEKTRGKPEVKPMKELLKK